MNKQNLDNISDTIKKRRNEVAIRTGYISLLQRILLLAIVGYLIFTQVFLVTRASGIEMFPAIKDGDLIIGFRLQQEYEKNDVITYKVNGERKVGRFIAQESDVVILDDTGTLLVNGAVQAGEIMYPTYEKEGIEYPYQVPENHVFILGDYRTQTTDSRDFGSIPMDEVEGKVITILRRRGL
ncbi:MAG TPA: signal peptidase I [Clostridia bacterium]|nr:signal peptidase I [Clostridia bacterium]